jgi:hypothetical protein
VDVFVGDGFFDDLLDAEGGVAGGVEILGRVVQGSFSASPGLNFAELHEEMRTIWRLSPSLTLTICPKEGMTLMLILLSEPTLTRLRRCCSGMTFNYYLLGH